MPTQAQRRALFGGAALAASAAAWLLSAANVEAAEWHIQWGDSPAVMPSDPYGLAGSTCPFSLPAGQPASRAHVGVHFNHTWLELSGWQGNLGYSPEAMSYYLCTNHQGASTWVSSPFYPLWYSAQHESHSTAYYSISPDYECPDDYFWIVGAFCQTRAWW